VIVGNDIVDRLAAGVPSERFVARVLTPTERALAAEAPDGTAFVWRLWAAKEAAYKVLARADGELPFAHRRFHVDPAAAVVRHERGQVTVRWAEDGAALVCWAWLGADAGPLACRVATVEEAEAVPYALSTLEGAGDGASRAVRRLAKWLLATMLGREPDAFEIRRPERPAPARGAGPPEVWLDGLRLEQVSLSLAHDGRFVSAAAGLRGAR
jgi:phosphopantetheinyl transferase (holo-ACP synthase)